MGGFVCIYYGNTGSSWLLDALGASPEVLVPGFEPVEAWAWDAPVEKRVEWVRTALSPPTERAGPDFEGWVDALRSSPQVSEIPASDFDLVGFKLNDLAVFATDALVEVLAETEAKAIVLTRDNRIKHALSLYRYHEEERSQFGGKGIKPPSRVKLGRFNEWVKESTRLHASLVETREVLRKRLGREMVSDVTYEEFITEHGKRQVIERLCQFLKIDPVDIDEGRFVKATPDDLASAVVNYNTLRLRYALTPMRTFFRE